MSRFGTTRFSMAAAALAATGLGARAFLAQPGVAPPVPRAAVGKAEPQASRAGSTSTSAGAAACAAAACAVAAGTASGLKRGSSRRAQTQSRGKLVAARAWPWEEEDPYAYCSAVKVQIGMQYTPELLAGLNKLSETCDTSTDEGLHQLLLDMVLLLQRQEANWRYGYVQRDLSSSEDEGRQANGQLQRWGVEGQAKWGDGQEYKDKNTPDGVTEYVVVTMLISCYGTVCPSEGETVKVRSAADLKKVIDAICGVQVDELIQLDVQWLPEEPGDSLSAMEMTVKFPEMMML